MQVKAKVDARDCIQWTTENYAEMKAFCGDMLLPPRPRPDFLYLQPGSSNLGIVEKGDWVISLGKNLLYVMKPQFFEQIYQVV